MLAGNAEAAIPIDRGDDASFDPRSWTTPRPERSRADSDRKASSSAADSNSFDPTTWVEKTAPPRPEGSLARGPTSSSSVFLGRPAVAVLVMLFLLIAGASAAFLSRPSRPLPAQHPPAKPHHGRKIILAETAKRTVYSPPAPLPQPGHSRRTVTLAGPERVAESLADLGISAPEAAKLTKLTLGYIGNASGELRLTADLARSAEGEQSLGWLEVTRIDGAGVRLIADGPTFKPEKLAAKLKTRTIAVRGEMGTTFYNSAVEAGVDDSLISDFAGAFNYDVDFQFELQPGDIFECVYEQDYNPWGEPVGKPRLLFASMRLQDKSLRFYRFKADGEYGWFDVDGRSNRRSFMRTPVDGARVSSGFGMRFHPILHYTRLHGGTDFAAPVGTPVYASGNGKVMVAACCHGDAGTMIALQHDNGWVTHYFHLSKIMPGIVPGVRVTQGEKIAEVGMTGGATGPHLHYEVVINGVKVDPLKVDTGQGITLTGAEMAAFKRERDRVDAARANGQS